MMRVDNLMSSVKKLTTENEVLSKCIQEISQQAASAEAETQLMKVIPGRPCHCSLCICLIACKLQGSLHRDYEHVYMLQEQIQAIRAMAASEEDRHSIDRLLDNAIAMAHSHPPHPQLPFQVSGCTQQSPTLSPPEIM
jgi:hypothetical protein